MNPILVTMAPRSGSSMVSGVFIEHGVWVGTALKEANEHNPDGYFEHTELFNFSNIFPGEDEWRRYIPDSMKGSIADKLRSIAQEAGYVAGPWLYKTEAKRALLWEGANPYWVCVRRNPGTVFKSTRKSKAKGEGLTDIELVEDIEDNNRIMDHIVANLGGVNVYSEDIIKGDLSSLDAAFQYCELEFDKSLAAQFIKPEYWHYKAAL